MASNNRTATRKPLVKGPNGRNMCRWCAVIEVTPPRQTFCSDECVHEFKLRSSPGYVRLVLFRRDHGVCAMCRLDTEKMIGWLNGLPSRGDTRAICEMLVREFGWPKSFWHKSFWAADHIVPVVEGGGECDLENIRTLCARCHRHVTAELARRRRKTLKPA